MKIVILEHPRIPSRDRFNDIANTPLWSCLLAGYATAALTAEGYDVTCLDAAAQGLDFDQARQRIRTLAPDLLAVNAVYFWEQTGRLLEFLTALKADRPAMHLTLFGFFPSLAPGQLLRRCPAVDAVCVGECEATLRALARAIDNGLPWQTVAGLAFTADGRLYFSADRPPASDPDRFPFPARPHPTAVGENDTAAILASRGCYNHCAFCPIPVFYNRGARWRGRSPDNILREVSDLMARGYRRFYFVDPNFIGPGKAGRRRTLELMQGLAPLKIRFGMETRPNDLDAKLLDAMRAAGLESLLLGIESGSRQVLGNLSKHASIDVSSRAIALCRRHGIEPEVGFLMHTPDTTVDDLVHNLEFLERNALLDRLARTANLLCHCQIVFRGTRGFADYRNANRILGTDPTGFEAHVAWRDPRARWLADVIVPVCLAVLRLTGDPQSPLYWKSAARNHAIAGRVNDRLTDAFRETLHRAGNVSALPAVETERRRINSAVLADL